MERRARSSGLMEGEATEGVFECVAKGNPEAGGRKVEAAGQVSEHWQRWEPAAITERRWKTLDRWWTWQTETNRIRNPDARRFQALIVAHEGVCRTKIGGVRCQKGGFTRQGSTLCGGCRADQGDDSAWSQTCAIREFNFGFI